MPITDKPRGQILCTDVADGNDTIILSGVLLRTFDDVIGNVSGEKMCGALPTWKREHV